MTEALRRLFWSVPVLVSFAGLLFFLTGLLPAVRAEQHFPAFFNARPMHAELAARLAIDDVLNETSHAPLPLAELGGAALPTVLDALPGLNVQQRRRIALALAPAATRIGLRSERWHAPFTPGGRSPTETRLADEELLLWQRYLDVHASDLKPLAVARLVRRITERRSQLRERDLVAVDSYALPALIESLGRIDDSNDVDRAARLVPHIGRSLGKDWQLRATDTPAEARRVCTEIRRSWDLVGPAFSRLNQVEKLLAHLTQTELFLWLSRSYRELAGIDASRLLPALMDHGSSSLPRFMAILVGLLGLGPLIAASIQVFQLGERRWRLERFGLRLALTAALCSALSVLLSKHLPDRAGPVLACLSMGAATSAFLLHRELNDRLDWRTHHVLRRRGPSARVIAVAGWLGPSLPTFLPMVVAEGVLWMSCIEVLSEGRGLGALAASALEEGDQAALMALTLGLVALTGTIQVLSDVLVGNFDLKRSGLQ